MKNLLVLAALAAVSFPATASAGWDTARDCHRPIVNVVNGFIYSNGTLLSRNGIATSEFKTTCPGIVIWVDTMGVLHKDTESLSRAGLKADKDWVYNDRTGTVVWSNNGSLFKDHQMLGSLFDTFNIARNTGDVAWMMKESKLVFRNGSYLMTAEEYHISEDGVIIMKLGGSFYVNRPGETTVSPIGAR